MDAINWLLINGGNAALWLGDVLGTFLVAVFGGLSTLLNWVLSPLLCLLNPFCRVIGDGVYTLLAPLPVWVGITIISAVTGVVMLVAFRYTSNQKAIGRARDDITANLLALKLFKDELRVTFRAQKGALGALGRLQWHMLRPLVIMLLPMLLMLGQMGVRYQWRPLRPGEEALVTLRLNPGAAQPTGDVELQDTGGIVEAIGPVPGADRLVWRIRAGQPGRYMLRFDVDGRAVEKELVVGDGFERVSAERPGGQWTAQILHPVEPPLPGDSAAASIEIGYAGVDSWVYGANWWILYFFIISMLFALLFKPFFKVRF